MTQLQLPNLDADSKNLDWFWNGFAHLSDAPNGVAKLRELILGLAVQGKLVPQDENDEPASELLKRIAAEKARLVAEKKIRKGPVLPATTREEIPFEIPNSWECVRLGNVGDWGAGATPNRSNPELYGGSVSWFKSGELNDGFINSSQEKLTDKALKECSLRLNKPNDVLIAMYGATIGKLAILEIEATTNQAVCACTCFEGFFNRYLFVLLLAYRWRFQQQGAGGAQPNISREKIIHTVAPLPPLAEQKRIVARVDELMALCDQLEAHQKQKRTARDEALQVNLNRLVDAPDAGAFTARWEALNTRFETLFDAPETVAPLRAAILQLAVQGKLEPQNPDDEPASVLLEQIATEKARLVAEKKLRKSEPLPAIDDVPFEIPDSWKWVRLGEISHNIHYGYTASSDANLKDVRLLRITDIQANKVNWETVPGCKIAEDLIEGYRLSDGDILIARTGGTIGKSYLVENVSVQAVFASYLIRVIPSTATLPSCIKLFLESPLYWRQLYAKSMGTGQPNVNGSSLSSIVLPLPPLAEQKRIVARVDALMALCDELEAGLKAVVRDSEEMAAVTVRSISAGQFS